MSNPTYRDVLEEWHAVKVSAWRWGVVRLFVRDVEADITDGCLVKFHHEDGCQSHDDDAVETFLVKRVLVPDWERCDE